MGCVFSCFAQSFLYVGELLENIFLALGEILSVLTRGIFSVLVGICDVLAAASCCWRVPYDQRPDRGTFVYSNAITKDVGGGKVLGKVVKSQEERARRREEVLKRGEGEREGKLSEEEAGATPAVEGAAVHGEKAVEAEGEAKVAKPAKEPFTARLFGGNKASNKKVDGSPAAGATNTDATTATVTTAEDGAAPPAAVTNVDEQPATAAAAATSPTKNKRSFWSGKSSSAATKPTQVDEAKPETVAAEPTTENAAEAPTVDASAAAASGTAAPASSRIQEPRGRWFFGGGKAATNGTPASKAEEVGPAEDDGAAEATPEVAAAETPAATETPVSKAPSKKGFAAWKSKKSTADKPTAPAAPVESDAAAAPTTAIAEDKPTEPTAATEGDANAKPKKDDGLKRAKTTLHTLWHGNGSGKKTKPDAAAATAAGAEAPTVPEKEGEAPTATAEGAAAEEGKAAA